MTKPRIGAETRWAGILPQISWCSEMSSALTIYATNPAKDTATNDDGTTYMDWAFDADDFVDLMDLDACMRPVSSFIATMEAGKRVTSSLSLPMCLMIMEATKATTPVDVYKYENGNFAILRKNGDELSMIAQEARRKLHNENNRRFLGEERVGHLEDLLICTILDPRFKLMNFVGCTAKMKADAEHYLLENYKADWSPLALAAAEKAIAKEATTLRGIVANGRTKSSDEEDSTHDHLAEVDSDAGGEVEDVIEKPKLAPIFKDTKKVDLGGVANFFTSFSNTLPIGACDPLPQSGNAVHYEEVHRYLRLPQLPMQTATGEDQDILIWWKDHVSNFPHLAKMARQFLGAPASSACAERLFSGAGKMHDDLKKATKESTLALQLSIMVNYPDA